MREALVAPAGRTRAPAASPPGPAMALPALLRCPEPDSLCPCHGGAPAAVAAVTASTGLPLDPATRLDMQARFGHDFGQVRVHTDQAAAASAHMVNALAYTVGPHIVFAAGAAGGPLGAFVGAGIGGAVFGGGMGLPFRQLGLYA